MISREEQEACRRSLVSAHDPVEHDRLPSPVPEAPELDPPLEGSGCGPAQVQSGSAPFERGVSAIRFDPSAFIE
jgi:hypothetical protein